MDTSKFIDKTGSTFTGLARIRGFSAQGDYGITILAIYPLPPSRYVGSKLPPQISTTSSIRTREPSLGQLQRVTHAQSTVTSSFLPPMDVLDIDPLPTSSLGETIQEIFAVTDDGVAMTEFEYQMLNRPLVPSPPRRLS